MAEYLSIGELAAKLKVSKATISEMRRKRLLPRAIMVSGSVRWIDHEVDEHLAEYARIDN